MSGSECFGSKRKAVAVDSVPLHRYVDSLATTVTPVTEPSSAPFLLVLPVDYAVVVLNLLLLFGVVALAWFWPRASRLGAWGTAALLTLLLTGPGYVAMLLVTEQVTFIIPGRYGLAVLPALAGCLAVVASKRRGGGPLLVALGVLELGLLVGYAL